ncbi:MAG TPA: hypothetical protein VIW29_18715 [Polyangiaceae bacterium]
MKASAGFGFGCVVLAAFLVVPGCSDDDHDGEGDPHGDAALVCQVMGELCHAADSGEGPAHDCHEIGHVGEGEACEAAFDGCMGVCLESDSGAGGAGGSGSGGAGGAEEPAKDPYCAALGELCHAVDDEDGPTHDCHELGHVNDPEICAASFDECATLCLEKLDEAEAAP